jgi:hypothetical protein
MSSVLPFRARESQSPCGLAALTVLATKLRRTRNHLPDELWQKLDPSLWQKGHHPIPVTRAEPFPC